MRTLHLLVVVAIVHFCSALASAQQPDPNSQNNPPQPRRDATVQVVPMGPGAMAYRAAGPMFGRDALSGVIMTLGEVNLSPGFDLSAEQKQKIQSIRDEFKQEMEKWRSEHADELKSLDEQQQALFENMKTGGGPPDPDQMRELMEARHQLMETAPDGEAQVEQVKAVLTPDQLKKLEEKQVALDAEREAMMQRMPIRMGPGGPGGPPPPPPGDKDKPRKDR